MFVSAIIAAGGSGRRLGAPVPKQLLDIGGRTMLQRTTSAFAGHARVNEVIVVIPADSAPLPADAVSVPPGRSIRIVHGGARRQDSVANGFAAVRADADVVLVHDAARPFVRDTLIDRVIDAAYEHGAAIAAIGARDTVKRVSAGVIVGTIPREEIYLAQTPQGFRREVLARAIEAGTAGGEMTDEAALAERAGYRVQVIEGDPGNVKITTEEDLEAARQRVLDARTERVGTGYDLHRLVEGRPLILGGVTVPGERGAVGHSDADVVCHAVIDALLGAAGHRDIGRHFPDTEPDWKDASSIGLLQQVGTMVWARGFEIGNVDVTVVLERPKIKDHVDQMRERMAEALRINVSRVSVKGKTNEGVDAVGRGEAVAAHAVALIRSRAR